MHRYTPAARIWIELVVLAAVVAAGGTLVGSPPTIWSADSLLAAAMLVSCGAVAHLFPIRSASDGATHRLTNVFFVAAAIVLPPGQLPLVALAAITPDTWLQRQRPGALTRWIFNLSQTVLAVEAAGWYAEWAHAHQLSEPRDLLLVLGAPVVFALVQEPLVGIAIARQSGIPLVRADIFTRSVLVSNALCGVLGIVVAGLWLSNPLLLTLIVPLLIGLHQLTRTAHLAHLAEVDEKTGLHNARHFERVLAEQLARSRRSRQPAALLFLDLDHFKRINDRHGHQAGDVALRQISDVLARRLRKEDVLARYGGEEFVALLPNTDAAEAMQLAERLRDAVEQHCTVLPEGARLRCTVSIGVALFPDDGDDVDALLNQADAALYRAKQRRNAVARATSVAMARQLAVEAVAPSQTGGVAHPRIARALLVATAAAGVLVTTASIYAVHIQELWSGVLPLLLLVVAAEYFKVRVYELGKEEISFSFGMAVSMAAVTTFPAGATLVSLTGALVHLLERRQRAPEKILFNLSNTAVAAGCAALVYSGLGPHLIDFSVWHLAAAVVSAATFYVINSGLISAMIGLHTGRRWWEVMRESAWYSPTKIFLGLIGAFMGPVYAHLGAVGLLVFGIPVLIMRFTLVFYSRKSQQVIETLQALNGKLAAEVAQRKQFEENLAHQALHDSLTDLPNRTLLHDRLEQALKVAIQDGRSLALLLLDLDRFKEINDTFGHDRGDAVLQQIGPRLRGAIRETDTIARLGGDEFGVLLTRATAADATRVAEKLAQALEAPLALEGHTLEVAASIGISIYPDHGDTADTLLRHADVAMYAAKREQSTFAVYASNQNQYSPDRLALVGELRAAIEQDGLTLHYQPKVDLSTGSTLAVEALVRWQHPNRGIMPPDEFVMLAEQTGLIRPLTTWVFDAALRQCAEWQRAGTPLQVAVNVSMRNIHDTQFIQMVQDALAVWRVSPEMLTIEITESSLMADAARAMEVLTRLRAMGVGIAIDDFGTGYSSLAYLKRLPVHELKIDRAFIRQLAVDENDQAIVRSVIAMGHQLGLGIVAEGVEDASTLELLMRMSCDTVQGYHLARPMAPAQLKWWFRDSQWGASTSRAAA